jgi:hypothetical protein
MQKSLTVCFQNRLSPRKEPGPKCRTLPADKTSSPTGSSRLRPSTTTFAKCGNSTFRFFLTKCYNSTCRLDFEQFELSPAVERLGPSTTTLYTTVCSVDYMIVTPDNYNVSRPFCGNNNGQHGTPYRTPFIPFTTFF